MTYNLWHTPQFLRLLVRTEYHGTEKISCLSWEIWRRLLNYFKNISNIDNFKKSYCKMEIYMPPYIFLYIFYNFLKTKRQTDSKHLKTTKSNVKGLNLALFKSNFFWSCSQVFSHMVILKNHTKFRGKHRRWSLFLI